MCIMRRKEERWKKPRFRFIKFNAHVAFQCKKKSRAEGDTIDVIRDTQGNFIVVE